MWGSKAKNKLFGKLSSANVEVETNRVPQAERTAPIVRVKANQIKQHKVICCGYTVIVEGEVPHAYKFQYPPDPEVQENLTMGVIPAGFLASVPAYDTCDPPNCQYVFFHTRMGAEGPEYQVAYGTESNALCNWCVDVDQVWIEALDFLEKVPDDEGFNASFRLSEDSLNYLDADPLYLFGIADPSTQAAVQKAAMVPMLKCMGTRPCIEEWFAYLNADPEHDDDYRWVIESFMEVQVPEPWTSYKGAGSIVCYLNNETNETSWKHPFFDYFAQLLDHCRRSTQEEHLKLRINRMLWSYEAEAQADVQNQMPLISPKYVKQMAEIVGIDLSMEPFMVRVMKTCLKAFSQQRVVEDELHTQEITFALRRVEEARERDREEKAKGQPHDEDMSEDIKPNVHKQLYCIECMQLPPDHPDQRIRPATCYCPECEDCLCESCFEKLHSKGNRSQHTPNHIIPCCLCQTMPAKLQCTYTFGYYCQQCYATKHVKTLPKYLDLKPMRIDYTKTDMAKGRDKSSVLTGSAFDAAADAKRVWATGETDPTEESREGFSKRAPAETTLGDEWHAFYDLRGVKYYYNFETQESLRRPTDVHIDKEAREEAQAGLSEGAAKMLRSVAASKEPRLLRGWSIPAGLTAAGGM